MFVFRAHYSIMEAMAMIRKITHITHTGIRDLNEDKVLVNQAQKVFGVFDGASSLDSYLSDDGKTGAYIAASIAADAFANTVENIKDTAIIANNHIEEAHLNAGVDLTRNVNRFGTTAAVIKVAKDHVDLLQVGDSVILLLYKNGHSEAPLGYHDHDIQVMREWRQLADSGASNIRDIVADDVIKLRESANIAYGMLNGDKRLRNFLKTGRSSLKDVTTILLLTDGMFIPKADPDAAENWEEYARLYQQKGLEGIYALVRNKELSDPGLIKYPRYKLHDDASAVAIDF
jgi:serine/threonine protein phosphatase PrpC